MFVRTHRDSLRHLVANLSFDLDMVSHTSKVSSHHSFRDGGKLLCHNGGNLSRSALKHACTLLVNLYM